MKHEDLEFIALSTITVLITVIGMVAGAQALAVLNL